MTPVEGVLGRVLLGVVHTGADAVPRVQRTFPRGGVPVSEPFLAVSAGSGFDDGRLNAFLASDLLRVARVVPIQAPASVSVVSSAAVRGSDTGVSGGLDADGVGRVGENAAACRVVHLGAAAARSSAGAVCQVMNPFDERAQHNTDDTGRKKEILPEKTPQSYRGFYGFEIRLFPERGW